MPPLDPYSRVFKPDFQADANLPQWQPMGGDDQGEQIGNATGSFVDLLKKRMAGSAAKGANADAAAGMGGMAGGAGGGPSGGGGMQSL